MASDRIDHAAEARRVAGIADATYEAIDPRNGEMSVAQMIEAQTLAHVAQVHATLALVEQQRVMNILKVDEMGLRANYDPGDEIREALGICE